MNVMYTIWICRYTVEVHHPMFSLADNERSNSWSDTLASTKYYILNTLNSIQFYSILFNCIQFYWIVLNDVWMLCILYEYVDIQ